MLNKHRPLPRLLKAVGGYRLADPVPRLHSAAVALAFVAAAAVARLLLEQVVPALLPFVLTVPAVIGAVLVAGAVAGWIALAGCQLLTLAFVLPHWIRDSGGRPQEAANLVLATASLALAVWATAAYRAAERRLRHQCEREVRTLSLLANEVDHRTKNNFQIAASLLHAQGRSANAQVREELDVAAGRLISIAAIYGGLSARGYEGGSVRLFDHLGDLADGLRAGLLPPGVTLTVAGDAIDIPAATALTVGLVVNEWVTNAVKYAFPGAVGTIQVKLDTRSEALVVEVRDNGVGIPDDGALGTGSHLLAGLVEVFDGRLHRRSDGGTVCTLTVPIGAE